ncbi:hypothetical protein HIM_08140 [Hirsutella minnesotensis 3608]|uniref:Uncharacterized protein n=1 Tax=Hirsutella minnesotensis 3608 TaxID=1043627 RepID=A0A0F7ZHD9_9HYPO|nr:hypothetical protein HIM_08140 [Hirsutella minnesotensis 3608]
MVIASLCTSYRCNSLSSPRFLLIGCTVHSIHPSPTSPFETSPDSALADGDITTFTKPASDAQRHTCDALGKAYESPPSRTKETMAKAACSQSPIDLASALQITFIRQVLDSTTRGPRIAPPRDLSSNVRERIFLSPGACHDVRTLVAVTAPEPTIPREFDTMDAELRKGIGRMTSALTDQSTIQQLSDSGRVAKAKREELCKRRQTGAAAAPDKAPDGKGGEAKGGAGK